MSHAIRRSWTTKEVLGCLCWLPAVSANEKELLEGETERSAENKELGGCSEVLEYEGFPPVSGMLVLWEEEPGFLRAHRIGGYKEINATNCLSLLTSPFRVYPRVFPLCEEINERLHLLRVVSSSSRVYLALGIARGVRIVLFSFLDENAMGVVTENPWYLGLSLAMGRMIVLSSLWPHLGFLSCSYFRRDFTAQVFRRFLGIGRLW